MNYKLPTTIVADVILLTSFDAIFTDISTVALRAFHGNYPRFHTLIMQRQIIIVLVFQRMLFITDITIFFKISIFSSSSKSAYLAEKYIIT